MALSDYQTLVDDFVRDDSGKILSTARDTAIALAVSRYSSDRPRLKAVDITSTGGTLLDLPDDWESYFSAIEGLEYPVGEMPPVWLEADSYTFYLTPSGQKILLRDALAAGQIVRLGYTASQVLSGTEDTIRPRDREAVCAWAAGSSPRMWGTHFLLPFEIKG